MAGFEENVVSLISDNPEAELNRLIPLMDAVIERQVKINELAKGIGGGSGLAAGVNAQGQLLELQKKVADSLAEQSDLKKKIAAEDRALAKEQQDAVRQANKAKAESDREYVANYKRLLKERDDAEKKSAKDAESAAKAATAAETKKIKATEDRLNKQSAAERKAADAKEKLLRKQDADEDKRIAARIKADEKAAAANRAASQKTAVNSVSPDSLKALSGTLEKARDGYSKLTAAERENEHIGGVLLARIKELDAQLKASDASQGKYTRNVGNYKSAFNGLGFSIRNIAGELPNIGISFRTFAQSISNNIGPLSDAIQQARAQNKALAAEGKATVPIGKQIAASVFSWQTAILALVAAFTYLAPKIEDFFSNIFKGKGSVDQLKIATEQMTKAFASTEYATAIQQVTELRTNLDLAKEGFLDKKSVIEQYNESIGKTIGQVTTLAGVEKALGDAAEAYIQMTLMKAAANAAFEEAAKSAVKAQVSLYKLQNPENGALEKVGGLLAQVDPLAAATGISPRMAQNRSIVETGQEAQKQLDAFTKIGTHFQEAAAKISALYKFNFFGSGKDKGADKNDPSGQYSARQTAIEAANAAEINGEIAKQKELARIQKRIADDDENTLEVRLQAQENYQNALKEIVYQEDAAEALNRQSGLDTLLKKEQDFNAGKIELTKYQYETLKIEIATAQKEIENLNQESETKITLITEDGVEARNKIRESEYNQAKKLLDGYDTLAKGVGPTQTRREYEIEQAKIRLQAVADSVRVEQELIGIVSDNQRKKLSAIDEEIAKVKELEDVRRKEIEASGLTEIQKKEAIAALEAKSANDLFQLNEKKRQQQLRNARFEKAANIAILIQETAIAVVRALGSKPFTPANIGLAIGIGAIGAANIARAATTPLPQYKDGTSDSGKAGVAIVGDGGRKEVIQTADGRTYVTPDRPTQVFMPAHSVVHKSVDDYIERAQGFTFGRMGVLQRLDERKEISTREMERQLKRIATGIDRVANKEPVNIKYIGRDWNNYIADIYH